MDKSHITIKVSLVNRGSIHIERVGRKISKVGNFYNPEGICNMQLGYFQLSKLELHANL